MRTVQVSRSQIEALSRALEPKSPEEILALCAAALGDRAAIMSSMQWADNLLCAYAQRAGLALDVLFVDTGLLHPETLAARDELVRTHDRLRVRTLAPSESFAAQTKRLGLLYVTVEGQKACCDLRKSDPLAAIRGEHDLFVSSLRRDEGGRRAKIGVVELDTALGVLRVHPFALASSASLRERSRASDVVAHPLHDLGFPSIGCFPCTTPVRPDEDERAGRWRHLADVAYCGINPTDRAEEAQGAEVGDRIEKLFALAGVAR